MLYVPLHERCPEVARRETRTLSVLPNNKLGLPAGDYHFHEMFCNQPGCDCRRVFFTVLGSKGEALAVIAWGWENRAFYARWLGDDDPEMMQELQGPALNLASPQSRYAGVLLHAVANVLLADPAYRERIKRHYALFRATIDGGEKRKRDRASEMLTKGLHKPWKRI